MKTPLHSLSKPAKQIYSLHVEIILPTTTTKTTTPSPSFLPRASDIKSEWNTWEYMTNRREVVRVSQGRPQYTFHQDLVNLSEEGCY